MKNKISLMNTLIAVILFTCFSASCSDDDDEDVNAILERDKPALVSAGIENNTTISPTVSNVNLTFDRAVRISDATLVTLNDSAIWGVTATGNVVNIQFYNLSENENYNLVVSKGAVSALRGVSNQEDITLSFSTSAGEALQLVSTDPENNSATEVSGQEAAFTFNQRVQIVDADGITLNNEPVNAYVSGLKLNVPLGNLDEETSYTLTVATGAIRTLTGITSSQTYTINFTTETSPIVANLATPNASREAQNVYNFLRQNFGKKIISGAMASDSWNTNEAQWIFKHTGLYPAMTFFDYGHLHESWLDYTNITVAEDWWNNNGLLGASWHWNVPASEGSSQYAFYTADTNFDISRAVEEGTYENGIVKADIDKIADRLLLFKNKNIPIIWRPLHEAAGGWFWWGAKGAEPCKALWQMMFDTFKAKGLDNVIWVWTAEPGDDEWYPGDEYVDIVGRDLYNLTTAAEVSAEYVALSKRYPHKIVTLSECGNVAGITDQWNAGAQWSWFMPWYDYDRTRDPNSNAFNQVSHIHADANFWRRAFMNENVITRNQMPDLK